MIVQLVERASQYPGTCMVRKTHSGPFIDLGMDFEPENTGRMYISVPVVRAICEKAGFVPREVLDDAHQERQRLLLENDELHARVAELEAFKASVQSTFEGAGFTRRRIKRKEEPVGT